MSDTEENRALIYQRTETDRVSYDELSKVNRLMRFAAEQDWEVVGAVLSPASASSAIIQGIVNDWERNNIHAVIVWDDETGRPAVWTDDLPNNWIRAHD